MTDVFSPYNQAGSAREHAVLLYSAHCMAIGEKVCTFSVIKTLTKGLVPHKILSTQEWGCSPSKNIKPFSLIFILQQFKHIQTNMSL